MKNFVLKDNLRHRAYSFPKTVLNFHKTGGMPDEKNDVLYVNGVKTPYEILPEKEGYILKTIADLPYNSERNFTFKKGENDYKPLGNDNGIIAVESINGGLYSVKSSFGAKFIYSIETELKKLSETEEAIGGAVESIFVKTLKFAGGKEYRFTLKLKRDLDYLEIYEEMKGFKEDEAKLVISWENFEPSQRYTTYRGKEKIDDYTDENGKIPFVINPFMPCNSAWDRPMLAYVAKGGEWSGVLLHDYKNFDDGDWTDPINGPGRKGKGVSTWTSMAFVYGMRTLVKILKHIGQEKTAKDVEEKIRVMSENIINACYKGDRFIAGYNDDGIPYGCKEDEEGSLFLNMHSWAIISGVATGKYHERCKEVIDELTTPLGVLVMKPPFTKWNAKFGKISVKQAGKDENGSVYCHASAFSAYALFMTGEKEKAESILKDILPTHEYKAEFEFQPPIFIPNYWFTKEPQYGYSSANVSTGTSAWFLKIYRDFYEKRK